MSAIKKRPPPPQSILQQHTDYILTQLPDCKPVLASSLSVLHSPFLVPSSATSLAQEWSDSKKRGLKALQTFAQAWIQHCSDAVSGHSIQKLYTDSFGPLTTPPTSVEESVLQSLSDARHRAAMRSAQVHLQHMRDALASMRKSYEKLINMQTQLRNNWKQLYQITQSIHQSNISSSVAGSAMPDSAARHSTPQKASSSSSSSSVTSGEEDAAAAVQEELLENVRIEKLLPTDLALSSNSNVTLQQAITVLSDLQQMYERDLHTKHSIVDAIAVIVDNTLPAPTSQGNANNSTRETIPIDQNQVVTSARLLQAPLPSTQVDPAQSGVANASTAAAQDELRFNTRNEPLEYYISTWMFEPDLSVQTTLNFKYIWETQLGPAAPMPVTSNNFKQI